MSVCANGEQAVVQAGSLTPVLVVMDVLMPVLDGCGALRQLRRAANWTPVIPLSQLRESAERAMALEDGADEPASDFV